MHRCMRVEESSPRDLWWSRLTQLKGSMDKDIPGRNGTRSVTHLELKRIVLTVASAVLNTGMSSFFRLTPISLSSNWSVMVPFDIERYSEHIKNPRLKHNDQVSKELGCLSKFYKHEKGAVHQEPMVVMDCHGRILLWYLPEVLSTARLVSSKLMNLTMV